MGPAIPVRPRGTITGYSSPEEAIRAATLHPRQPQAREASGVLLGRHLVAARWDLQSWVIEFSGSVWLRVSVGVDGVDWAVEPTPSALQPASEPVAFDWGNRLVAEMDSRILVEPRRGAEFWQLWMNEAGLWLYLRKQPILAFHVVERRDTGEVLLFACDSD
jgi:hypothetical protein